MGNITQESIIEDLRYLQLLSHSFPTIADASTEIINLEAILNLPKGTEHFLTDLHGEYEAFQHVLKNASGAVKRKVNEIFGHTLRESEKKEICTLIYYPEEKLRLIKENDPGNIGSGLIPLCLDPTNAMYHFVTSQCNHAAPETAIYKNEDGVYVWGPAGEDVYEALKIYQDAYKEGLLDPEFYLMNDDDKERFYINGTAAMYQMGGVAEFRQTCDTEMNNNLRIDSDEAVHNAIVLGNDGKYHNLILGSNYWSSLIFSPEITDENFERIMDLIDWTCTQEGQYVCNMGLEGIDWVYDEDGNAVSILDEDTSVYDKYGARIESLYILEDDFAVVNPMS